MAGLGNVLYNALLRVPVVGSAVTWFNEAEKQKLIEFIKADKDNVHFKATVDQLFDGLHYCYKTDPDVVINIIKVSQHHNGLDHNYVIEKLPEELRTLEFVIRILKEVIFERIDERKESSVPVSSESFIAIDPLEGKLDLIKSQILEDFRKSARGMAEPLEYFFIRDLLFRAKTNLKDNYYYFRLRCLAF